MRKSEKELRVLTQYVTYTNYEKLLKASHKMSKWKFINELNGDKSPSHLKHIYNQL